MDFCNPLADCLNHPNIHANPSAKKAPQTAKYLASQISCLLVGEIP